MLRLDRESLWAGQLTNLLLGGFAEGDRDHNSLLIIIRVPYIAVDLRVLGGCLAREILASCFSSKHITNSYCLRVVKFYDRPIDHQSRVQLSSWAHTLMMSWSFGLALGSNLALPASSILVICFLSLGSRQGSDKNWVRVLYRQFVDITPGIILIILILHLFNQN